MFVFDLTNVHVVKWLCTGLKCNCPEFHSRGPDFSHCPLHRILKGVDYHNLSCILNNDSYQYG